MNIARFAAQADAGLDRLGRLVYRSRATVPFGAPELRGLVDAARRRNEAEDLSGLIVFDGGAFFQWLEGPARNLARVADSITRDPRHDHIEVLSHAFVRERRFSGWSLQLATSDQDGLPDSYAVRPDPGAVISLHGAPNDVPTLLASFAPQDGRGPSAPERRVLRRMLEDALVPRVLERLGERFGVPAPDSRRPGCPVTARALLADPAGVRERLCAALDAIPAAMDALAEVQDLARDLGDLWAGDVCDEVALLRALDALCGVLRALSVASPGTQARPLAPRLAVAAVPGEPHVFGAALAAHVAHRAGWRVVSEFPADEEALVRFVRGTRADAVVLCLSETFRRAHRLGAVGQCVRSIRAARPVPVLLRGRAFDGRDRDPALGPGCACGAVRCMVGTLAALGTPLAGAGPSAPAEA